MKSIQQYALAMLMFTVEQIAANEPKAAESGAVDPNAAEKMTYLNARFWVSVFFILIALVSAYKIASDNVPDTNKDSILYAKFLQIPRDKRHGE